jgi:hypothetical protein
MPVLFFMRREKVAECVAEVFKKYRGFRELMNDLMGTYRGLRRRVLNMALAQYSGTIAVT